MHLKKAVSFLVVMLILSMCSAAYAADEPPADPGKTETTEVNLITELNINVKHGATKVQEAFETEIKAKVTSAGKTLEGPIEWMPSFPEQFTSSGTAQFKITYSDGNFETDKVSYKVISPEAYTFKNTISNINSVSNHNKSNSTLLNYINSDLTLTGTGSDYLNAVGTEPDYQVKPFSWSNCDTSYVPTGRTYTFKQSYNGCILTRVLTVNEANYDEPSIRIDEDDCIIKTSSDVEYSLDRISWRLCSKDMQIPSTWYDSNVYFRYPKTQYYSASPYSKIHIPPRNKKPPKDLQLVATSHSITIANCWEFDHCEYSIDKKVWKTTGESYYIFSDLKSKTSYTIYVRARSDDYLASEPKSKSITTKDDEKTGINVDYSVLNDTGHVNGTAKIESTEHDNYLTGALSDANILRFESIISSYLKDYSVVFSSLKINQYTEEYYNKNLETVRFDMPLSRIKEAVEKTNLEIEYHCDFADIHLDNDCLNYYEDYAHRSTLFIEVTKFNSYHGSKYSWIKEQLSNDRPVYYLSVQAGSRYSDVNVSYSLLYNLKRNETIHGVQVYYVDRNGDKTRIPSSYDAGSCWVTFTTDKVGYFVIVNDSTTAETMNFTDVRIDHWAYNSIKHCYNRGFFTGVSKSKFDLASPVTRGTIITLLSRLDGNDTASNPVSNYYSDVKTTDWFAPGANWAYMKGLITSREFKPNDKVSREAIAVLIYQYLKSEGYSGETNTILTYTDCSSMSQTSKTAVAYLKDLGIMSGSSKDTFNPKGNVTRAEMAAIIYRLYNLISDTTQSRENL